MGLAAQGGARRSTCQGRAGDQKTRDRSVQQTGANRGGAKELKGASGGRVEELSGFHRRGGRGRLGGTITREMDQRRRRFNAGQVQRRRRRLGTGWDQRRQETLGNNLFQFHKIFHRGQMQLTLSGWCVCGAYLHTLVLYKHNHRCERCCRLMQLVRLFVGLRLRGDERLRRPFWLRASWQA